MTKRWLGPVVIMGMLAFSALVYGSLPERMATHWNGSGEADDWSSRLWGAVVMPVVAGGMWLLLLLLRRVDPRGRNYERFDATFWLIVNLTMLLMAGVHVVMLGAALGWAIDVARVMTALMGVMFIGLGNYLPRVRSNWWMGIRTPWTLESESVWRATHRLAGYTFVGAGAVAVAAALLPTSSLVGVAVAALLAAGFVPAVYSYILYRREQRAA